MTRFIQFFIRYTEIRQTEGMNKSFMETGGMSLSP